jgi:hypothetical protein
VTYAELRTTAADELAYYGDAKLHDEEKKTLQKCSLSSSGSNVYGETVTLLLSYDSKTSTARIPSFIVRASMKTFVVDGDIRED